MPDKHPHRDTTFGRRDVLTTVGACLLATGGAGCLGSSDDTTYDIPDSPPETQSDTLPDGYEQSSLDLNKLFQDGPMSTITSAELELKYYDTSVDDTTAIDVERAVDVDDEEFTETDFQESPPVQSYYSDGVLHYREGHGTVHTRPWRFDSRRLLGLSILQQQLRAADVELNTTDDSEEPSEFVYTAPKNGNYRTGTLQTDNYGATVVVADSGRITECEIEVTHDIGDVEFQFQLSSINETGVDAPIWIS